MAATRQAEMMFRSTGALLLACIGTVSASGTGGLVAQDDSLRQFVGTPLPDLSECELVRPGGTRGGEPTAYLVVLLPSRRAALLAAERDLARWVRELEPDAVRIEAVLPAEAAELASVQRRSPRGRHGRSIDRRGDVTRWFEAVCVDRQGARYVLADAQRRVLRAGRMDDGVRHELADVVEGHLDLAAAVRIAGASGGPDAAAAVVGDAGRTGFVHWSEVVDRVEHLAWPQGRKELERIVDDAVQRFGERPVWLAHVAEAVLQRSPALAADGKIRKVLAAGLRRAPLDPTLRRAAFRVHAGVFDDRRARGHGMAWLEACKSVPGRCGEVLDVLEDLERGTERFADLTARVFELGLDVDPDDAWLAKKAFEHFAARTDGRSEARDYGLRYVATLRGDAQSLNSFAWKLLTRDGYAGRHQELALAAARAMESDPTWRAYWRVDTLALACYENGRYAEAVALQREAVEAADGSAVSRYTARLERYQQALAAARRKLSGWCQAPTRKTRGSFAGVSVQSKQLSPDLAARVRALRHDLHRHPELGFQERRTQSKVREWLVAHGWQPRDCAGTGLVAEREGSAGDGLTIAVRADLDALPIHETTDLEYRSVHDGVAHKCGHDGHTAVLCAVAAALGERLPKLRGRVRLLFQPAEEGATGGGGGGRIMVEDGALDGVDQVFGLHNWPGFPKGEVRVKSGVVMAAEHRLAFTIRGRGGHASEPQRCIDPIAAGTRFVQSLYVLVARSVGLQGGAVLTITEFRAGTANNIIPERAELTGTIRSLDEQLGERLADQVRQAVVALEQAMGVTVDAEVERAYPAVVNDPAAAERVARAAARVLGDDRVSAEGLPLAAAEDFAYMAAAVPGCYFLLGAGDPVGETPGCHHPDFDFDDALLDPGAAVFLAILDDALG